MRRGCGEDEVPVSGLHQFTKEVVTLLLLTAPISTGSCRRVRFVDDDQVGGVVKKWSPVFL